MSVTAYKKGVADMTGNERHGITARAKAKIRKKGQVTITKDLLDALGAAEGDDIEFKVVDGVLIGVPMVTITVPKDQSWYWTEGWQREEREVDDWVAQGGLRNTPTLPKQEALAVLEKLMNKE